MLAGALGSPGMRSYSGPKPRAHHTAASLADDRLLCFGGSDGETSFADAHVLDLSTMGWSQPTVRGAPPAARSGHAAVCLDGVRVLVHGGWVPSTVAIFDDVALLDTDTWSWSRPKLHGAPPRARVGHSLVAMNAADGRDAARLVLFGGRADGDAALDDLYELRPVAA